MADADTPPGLDIEMVDLPPEERWRHWMQRIEAVIFASSGPVSKDRLSPLVGRDVPVDLLIDDIRAELVDRPYELVDVAGGWMFRTRRRHATAIRAAAEMGDRLLELTEFDLAVLAAIAWHQPIDRDGLKDIFGKSISRDLLGRLRRRDLIATGPRSPRPGAPHTFVTTPVFLTTFDLKSLRDLPEPGVELVNGDPFEGTVAEVPTVEVED